MKRILTHMGKLTFLFATHFKQTKQIKKHKKIKVLFPEQNENNSHHCTLTLIYDSILSVIPNECRIDNHGWEIREPPVRHGAVGVIWRWTWKIYTETESVVFVKRGGAIAPIPSYGVNAVYIRITSQCMGTVLSIYLLGYATTNSEDKYSKLPQRR